MRSVGQHQLTVHQLDGHSHPQRRLLGRTENVFIHWFLVKRQLLQPSNVFHHCSTQSSTHISWLTVTQYNQQVKLMQHCMTNFVDKYRIQSSG